MKYLLILSLILCTVVLDYDSCERTKDVRFFIWGITTLALFLGVIRSRKFKYNNLLLVFCGYFIFVFLSGWLAINKSEWLYETLRTFIMLTYLFCAINILDEIPIKPIAVLGCMVGVYGLFDSVYWQVTSYFPGSTSSEVIGLMGSRNLWCHAMLLLLPFCIFVCKDKKYRLVGIVGSMALLTNLMILSSRTALLGLIVAVGSLCLLKKKTLIITVLVVVMVAGIVLVYKPIIANEIPDALIQRLRIYGATIEMTRYHPMGIGAGSWRIGIPNFIHNIKGAYLITENTEQVILFSRVHNDFLQVLSEIGVLGFGFYSMCFVLAIYYSVRSRNYLTLMFISAYITIAMFCFPAEWAFHCMMLMIVFACIGEKKEIELSYLTRFIPACIVVSVLLLALVDIGFRWRTDRFMKRIRMNRDNWQVVLDETEGYSWFDTMDFTGTPIMYYRGMALSTLNNKYASMKCHERAYWHNPTYLQNLNQLGIRYTNAGEYERGKRVFQKAIRIQPDYEAPKKNIAIIEAIK